MPRHRRRVVDAVSDHIEDGEDDDATRRRGVDADDIEDQQPRLPQATASRKARDAPHDRGAARDGPDPEADDTQDATPAFDEDAFGNKPLSRHDAQKLQGIASDWNMIETNLKESAFSLLTEVSTAVAEYADEGTAQEVSLSGPSSLCMSMLSHFTQELDRLDGLMREVIDIDVEIRTHEQTLRDLHQQVVVGDEIVSEFSASNGPFVCLISLEQHTGALSSASKGKVGRLWRED
jgi:E3 SUMO-protein ligase NSE2